MRNDNGRDLSGTELADRIERIWKDVLNAHDAPASSTFFDLQGQSISAVRIAGRIEDELGIEVNVGLLFEDPDLASFVRQVLVGVS